MTASITPFPNPTNIVRMQQHVANLALLPARGSSLIFMTENKLGAGTVIVALPNNQIMIKVEDNTRHPKSGQTIWISRKDIRTHAIFTPPNSDLIEPPTGPFVEPDDFPPAAA